MAVLNLTITISIIEMVLEIFTRDAWGAWEPRPSEILDPPVGNVILAYTRTIACAGKNNCKKIIKLEQQKHMNLKRLTDIVYSFLIDVKGNVFEGRGLFSSPILPVKLRSLASNSIYVVLIGDFQGSKTELVVKREDWGAEPTRRRSHLDSLAAHVFVTYSGKNPCSNNEWCVFAMKKLQKNHIYERNCPDIRYNFCIGGNGKVYEGRGWEVRPTLPKRYSEFTTSSVYIAYLGNFVKKRPGDHMHQALEKLIRLGVRERHIKLKFLQFRI